MKFISQKNGKKYDEIHGCNELSDDARFKKLCGTINRQTYFLKKNTL